MAWDLEDTTDWYDSRVGKRIRRRLLAALRRWPVLAWRGREAPAVLAVGAAGALRDLWPGVWVEGVGGLDEGARFDRIVALHALERVEDAETFLATLRGRLVAGGLMVVLVPNRWSPCRYWPRWSPFGEGRGFGRRALARLAREAELTLIHQSAVVPVWPEGKGFWAPLPGLARVAVLRKDEPAVTRLRLKPLRNPAAGDVAAAS